MNSEGDLLGVAGTMIATGPYVGCTRARESVLIIFSGKPSRYIASAD